MVLTCVQPWNLHHPPHIRREQLVVAHPRRQFRPLVALPAVNGHAILSELVLVGFQVVDHLLGQLGQVTAVDEVVVLEENFPKSGLADGVVLAVELIEAIEDSRVRLTSIIDNH